MNQRKYGADSVQKIFKEMDETTQVIAEIQEELHEIIEKRGLDYEDVDELSNDCFCNLQYCRGQLQFMKDKIKNIPKKQEIRDSGSIPVELGEFGVMPIEWVYPALIDEIQ